MKITLLIGVLAAAALAAPAALAQDRHAAQMQEESVDMPGKMDKIRQTTDPAEGQQMTQEHMQLMHAYMEMSRSLGELTKRHEMMERRVDMMQAMMEQMMRHGQARSETR